MFVFWFNGGKGTHTGNSGVTLEAVKGLYLCGSETIHAETSVSTVIFSRLHTTVGVSPSGALDTPLPHLGAAAARIRLP